MLNLNSLNPQQRQAVETLEGPVLILAGAGTGKTRVITTRIAHMIAKRISPSSILAVTFTNKAAREMQERVNQLIPRAPRTAQDEKPDRPTICTFHSLCVRILRQHIEHLGYKRNFVIFDESEQLGAVKKILSQITAKGEKTDPGAVLGMLSRFKNCQDRTGVFGDPDVIAMAEHVRSRYESALRACNAVDFDDLILLALRLFDEFPAVLEACRAKYRYVMVDEYQDTNSAQFRLVHALTREHRNFCVVGDDDQSIYGWRGAEVANLLDMERHFPEVKVIKLEQNYRSTSTILTAANAVIKHNARRRGKHLWSQKGQGEKITLFTFGDDDEEARTVVEEIEFARQARRVPWSDHAILFRTNGQSRPLETALRKAGVRYHLVGGQSFFDRREVRDFMAYLKAFLNPHDDISLLRIANVPARGMSDTTMQRLLSASQERKGSVFSAMKNPVVTAAFPAKARESIDQFVSLLERGKAGLHSAQASHQPRTLQGWAEALMNEVGYIEDIRRSEKDPETAEGRIRNLRDMMASLDGDAPPGVLPADRLEAFLEEITLDSGRESEKEAQGDEVTLITMHSCKGLEFPHVFVVGLEDGLLPHSRSKVEGTMDEERRLFYVAITRAMQTLTLSYCLSRKKYGQALPCHPSPFLKELPPHLVEHAEDRVQEPVSEDAGKNWFASMKAGLE